MNITKDILLKIFPGVHASRGLDNKLKNIDGFIYTFNKYSEYFDIDTKLEVCHFLSQLGHESDSFNAFEEYSTGKQYEGRKDLGNIYKGDGIKFKGRGPIQTTGRSNYIQVGRELLKLPFLTESERQLFINDNIIKNPSLLADPVWGTLAAFIYWNTRDLNNLCKPNNQIVTIKRLMNSGWKKYDCSPVEALTRKINGGMNGYDDRLNKFNKCITLINI